MLESARAAAMMPFHVKLERPDLLIAAGVVVGAGIHAALRRLEEALDARAEQRRRLAANPPARPRDGPEPPRATP